MLQTHPEAYVKIKVTMNKYKILIFDLDDTLIDNRANVRHAYTKMIESVGEAYSTEGFQRWYEIDKKFWQDRQNDLIKIPVHFQNETGKKSDEFLDWLRSQRVLIYFNYQISQEEAIRLNNLFMNALTECVIAIDGARDVLQYLKEKYHIIVATNGPKIAAKDKLSQIGCLDFVDKVLSADMLGYMKPKREFFDAIQNLLQNHNATDYLITGDSLKSDVEFAMNCGFDSCWFNQKREDLPAQYHPTIIIEALRELKSLL